MYDTLLKKPQTFQKSGTRQTSGKTAQAQKQTLQPKAFYATQCRADENSLPNRTGLPERLKNGIENLSGFSMDDVRVHYNSSRPAQFHALAYTQGTDIHVAPGQEKHLAHEAWHVVQQKQGRVHPTLEVNGVHINDSHVLEHETDTMGSKAVQCKTADRSVRVQGVNRSCMQRVLPITDLSKLGITGIEHSGDTGEVSVSENGEQGNDVIKMNESPTQGRTAKQKALRAISIMAGNIGECVHNSAMVDNEKEKENFYVTIIAQYNSRGNQDSPISNVTLKLKYDFRKGRAPYGVNGGPGYIVNVTKSRKTPNDKAEANMTKTKNYDSSSQYSNRHTTNDLGNTILSETYAPKGKAPVDTNFDAYTKLAGEGARFQCVRENMDKLTDNTVFYARDQSKGIKFSDLWRTWSATFGMAYNIPNKRVADELSTHHNQLCTFKDRFTSTYTTPADATGQDAICLN